MSPRLPLVLNLLILLVNFVLLCAHAATGERVLRASARASSAPVVPLRRWGDAARPRAPKGASTDAGHRDTGGAIGPIPHTRLFKFLARLDGAEALSARQRAAVYDALAHCCRAMPRAAERMRRRAADPRRARDRIEREVAERLRAGEFRDGALARMVRVVLASAG